ncbi:MAG: type II toxin-antitoxin system Phd/YefM family antitoxin [Deltaproteobacteria bacterium]|nr:type II toxin-antitoxin system Phd/YefM family antitoxin [Deltaproteobacteria bacterium]
MVKKVSVAEAKNNLPSIIHEVEQGSRVEITRHGKSVAVVVATSDYAGLMEKGKGLWNDLSKIRNIMASEGIVVEGRDFQALRDASDGRPFEWTV